VGSVQQSVDLRQENAARELPTELRGGGARLAASAEPNEGPNAQNFAILRKATVRKTPFVLASES
jgi:hypothetical protein